MHMLVVDDVKITDMAPPVQNTGLDISIPTSNINFYRQVAIPITFTVEHYSRALGYANHVLRSRLGSRFY